MQRFPKSFLRIAQKISKELPEEKRKQEKFYFKRLMHIYKYQKCVISIRNQGDKTDETKLPL